MEFLFGSLYEYFLIGMSILAVIIFVILQFVTPAYGMTFNNRWGMSVKNKLGWFIMESPVFIAMTFFYIYSLQHNVKPFNWVTLTIFVFFQLHYFERSFIFPPLMRGNSKMPISIIAMGFFFNTANAYMQGGWLFYVCPDNQYDISWFWSLPFIIGTILFFLGMVINMHSDRIIRKLRKDKKDNNYYIPQGFLFKKISSANYFGEILEWVGFAVLSWSPSGVVFILWSFANIVPRSKAVYERYIQFFGDDFKKLKRNKIFPYIY